MPHLKNKDISIRYELAGDETKPPLVLVFGISMSCEDWFELGYVARLAASFRLVCVDLRGHGASAHPDSSRDYALEDMASDVETVIEGLGLERPILWGYSLGAKVALAAAGRDPSAYSALILGGFELHSVVNVDNDLVAETFAQGSEAWLSLWQQMFDVPKGMAERLAGCDTQALHALRLAEAEWPSLAGTPEKIEVPVLLYAGEHCFFRDATASMARRFPTARYIERPGRNHFDLMTESSWITREVIDDLSAP
nr:alpha/beta fold hydrolase [uncultured Nitratireductor sp.]